MNDVLQGPLVQNEGMSAERMLRFRGSTMHSGFVPPLRPHRGMEFTVCQRRVAAALVAFLNEPAGGVFVLRGFAGTGKSTLLGALVKVLEVADRPFWCMAPTGKAALRLSEVVGETSTIHSWVYVPEEQTDGSVRFVSMAHRGVPEGFVGILDEASMLDLGVWDALLDAVPLYAGRYLVLSGDGFQLPPVESEGAAPFTVMRPERLPLPRVDQNKWALGVMTEVVRQAQDSPILAFATALRSGVKPPVGTLSDKVRISTGDFARVQGIARAWGAEDAWSDRMLLTFTNQSRHVLNDTARTAAKRRGVLEQGEVVCIYHNDAATGLRNGELATVVSEPVVREVYDHTRSVQGARLWVLDCVLQRSVPAATKVPVGGRGNGRHAEAETERATGGEDDDALVKEKDPRAGRLVGYGPPVDDAVSVSIRHASVGGVIEAVRTWWWRVHKAGWSRPDDPRCPHPACGGAGSLHIGPKLVPHFAHKPGENERCALRRPMTLAHFAAQICLRDGLEDIRKRGLDRAIRFRQRCFRCEGYRVELPSVREGVLPPATLVGWDRTEMEFRIGDAEGTPRVLDVALLSGDRVLLALEVCVAAPVSDGKRSDLERMCIPWLEVAWDTLVDPVGLSGAKKEDGGWLEEDAHSLEGVWEPTTPLWVERGYAAGGTWGGEWGGARWVCPVCRKIVAARERLRAKAASERRPQQEVSGLVRVLLARPWIGSAPSPKGWNFGMAKGLMRAHRERVRRRLGGMPAGDHKEAWVGFPLIFADYGYSLTVHRAQGSEAREVAIWAADALLGYDTVDALRWTYTATTRAIEALDVTMGTKVMWAVKKPPPEVKAMAEREAENPLVYGRDMGGTPGAPTRGPVAPESVYFAHSLLDFGSDAATTAKGVIAEQWPQATVNDPEEMDLPSLKTSLGSWAAAYAAAVGTSEGVVVLEHEGAVGKGVFEEVRAAVKAGKPVWVVRGMELRRLRRVSTIRGGDWKKRYGQLEVAGA